MDIYTRLTKWANQSGGGKAERRQWKNKQVPHPLRPLLWARWKILEGDSIDIYPEAFMRRFWGSCSSCCLFWALQLVCWPLGEKSEGQVNALTPTAGDRVSFAKCSEGLALWVKQRKKNWTPTFVRAGMISAFQFIILGWRGCNSIKDRNIKYIVKPPHVDNLWGYWLTPSVKYLPWSIEKGDLNVEVSPVFCQPRLLLKACTLCDICLSFPLVTASLLR